MFRCVPRYAGATNLNQQFLGENAPEGAGRHHLVSREDRFVTMRANSTP